MFRKKWIQMKKINRSNKKVQWNKKCNCSVIIIHRTDQKYRLLFSIFQKILNVCNMHCQWNNLYNFISRYTVESIKIQTPVKCSLMLKSFGCRYKNALFRKWIVRGPNTTLINCLSSTFTIRTLMSRKKRSFHYVCILAKLVTWPPVSPL